MATGKPRASLRNTAGLEGGVETATDIISRMVALAPPGPTVLSGQIRRVLQGLTTRLRARLSDAVEEDLARFRSTRSRALELQVEASAAAIRGRRVLVTGGTGCIGSVLLERFSRLNPAALISVSRGRHPAPLYLPDVDYIFTDVRDAAAIDQALARARPAVVFHLAAQRDPAKAEREVHETLTTNILGSCNLIDACRHCGVERLVFASTGKALRPYTSDVYAASKKACEFIMASGALASDLAIAGARFTHVVDNSLIERSLEKWILRGKPIRLHDPRAMFYVQCAGEAADLLLVAASEAPPRAPALFAIRDLDWPIGLLNLALGVVGECGLPASIHFCGYEDGYEAAPYHALYDARLSPSVSPLINAFEAPATVPSRNCAAVDVLPALGASRTQVAQVGGLVSLLRERMAAPSELRAALNSTSWTLLDAQLRSLPRESICRLFSRVEEAAGLAAHPDHVEIDRRIRAALARPDFGDP
ncbi:MAG TPA: polysaccharide biosynthesis protein [Chthonomonadaceae bacterium]|nr:polysaccharide biosynthesis protein [Chthonomonadaceae bacterium]